MTGLIVRRLLQLPLILLVIYTLTLLLAWAVPGDPLANPERRTPPAVAEAMRAQYNLDSLPRFYASYLWNASGARWAWERVAGAPGAAAGGAGVGAVGAARGGAGAPPGESVRHARFVFDLGPSLEHEDWRVNEIIGASLPVSVTLGATAMLLALVVGVGAGVLGAVRPNSWADVGTLCVALVGISQPTFVIGAVLQLVFAVWLGVFRVAGWGELRDLVLPAVTLSLPFAAYIARLTRMGMIEHLSAEFVVAARARGVPERAVLLRHALKNAFLPVLSYLGPATATAMTGSFVVERVFNVPGLGKHFVNAVQNKDLFLIIGVVLVFSTMLVLFNLAVDVLYRWVDPRIE